MTYNTLVDAYTKAGWRARARGALEAARRSGVRLDAWSYSPLVADCCQAGDVAGALGIVAEMRAAGVVPNVVHALAEQEPLGNDEIQEAWTVIRVMGAKAYGCKSSLMRM